MDSSLIIGMTLIVSFHVLESNPFAEARFLQSMILPSPALYAVLSEKGFIENPLTTKNHIDSFIIIDGQQRFTTLYILIKALADSAAEEADG